MATPQFDLQAQLKIVGPVNIRPIIQSIQTQLKSIKGNVNINVNRNVVGNITSTEKALSSLSLTLLKVSKNTHSASQAFSELSKHVANVRSAATALKTIATPAQQASKEVAKLTTGIEKFGQDSARALKRNAAFLIPTTAIFAFAAATKIGIGQAIQFEREMVRLSQITGRSLSGLQGAQKEITKLSKDLGVSSLELAKVSTTLAQAGFGLKDVTTILKGIAESSLAPTFDSMEETTEAVIAAFSQFELKAEDVRGVLGSLNSVAAAYAVESSDLEIAIKTTGGAFKAAGGNLNELLALFTSVRSTTRESAEAIATGFRTIFTRLQRPRTIEFLKEFGIELSDLEGKFVGPYEAVRRLAEGLSNLDSRDTRFSGIVEELGGFRQVSRVIPLLTQNAKAAEAYGVALQGVDSLALDAARAQEALLVQAQKVKEEFNELFRTVVNDAGFQALAKGVFALGTGFAHLAKSIAPVIPLLAIFAGIRLSTKLPTFGKGFLGFAAGGKIPGSGGGDNTLIRATPGEYMLKKSTVDKIGIPALDHLNNIPGYDIGGVIGRRRSGNSFESMSRDDFIVGEARRLRRVRSSPSAAVSALATEQSRHSAVVSASNAVASEIGNTAAEGFGRHSGIALLGQTTRSSRTSADTLSVNEQAKLVKSIVGFTHGLDEAKAVVADIVKSGHQLVKSETQASFNIVRHGQIIGKSTRSTGSSIALSKDHFNAVLNRVRVAGGGGGPPEGPNGPNDPDGSLSFRQRLGIRAQSAGARLRGIGPVGILGAGAGLLAASQALPEQHRAAAQGLISGAVGGAAAGSLAGPVGTVIGGVIGGLKGLTDAIDDTAKGIEQAHLDEVIERLTPALKDLGNAKGLTKEQSESLLGITNESQKSAAKQIGLASNGSNSISGFLGGLGRGTRALGSQINPFSDNRVFEERLRDVQTNDLKGSFGEIGGQSEKNVLLLQQGLQAKLRGGASAKDLANSDEAKALTRESGIAELNKRFQAGDLKSGHILRRAFQKNDFGQVNAAGGGKTATFIKAATQQEALNDRLNKFGKAVNDGIGALQKLSQEFSLAASNLDKLDDSFSSANTHLGGGVSALKLREGDRDITFGANNQEGRISALGSQIGGPAGDLITKRGLEVQNIAKTLPGLLEAQAQNPANTIDNGLADKITAALNGSDLAEVVNKNLAQKGDRSVLDLAKIDPQQAAKTVFGDTQEAFQKITGDLVKATTAGSNKILAAFTNLAEYTDKVAALGDEQAKAQQELSVHQITQNHGNVPLSVLLGASNASQSRLLGGVGNNVGAISAALRSGHAQAADLTKQIQANPELAHGPLGDQLAKVDRSNANLTKAMDNLAHPTEKLAAINQKISDAESRRSGHASAAETLLNGTAADKARVLTQLKAAHQFTNLNPAQRTQVIKGLNVRAIQNLTQGLRLAGHNDLAEETLVRSTPFLNPIFGNAQRDLDQARAQQGGALTTAVGAIGAQRDLGGEEAAKLRDQTITASKQYIDELNVARGEAARQLISILDGGVKLAKALESAPTSFEHKLTAEVNVNFNGVEQFKQMQPFIEQLVIAQVNKTLDPEAGPKRPVPNKV